MFIDVVAPFTSPADCREFSFCYFYTFQKENSPLSNQNTTQRSVLTVFIATKQANTSFIILGLWFNRMERLIKPLFLKNSKWFHQNPWSVFLEFWYTLNYARIICAWVSGKYTLPQSLFLVISIGLTPYCECSKHSEHVMWCNEEKKNVFFANP